MDEPGLRERKKRRTRDTILEVALRLFLERGFEATTVEEIAAAADVSPRTFFRYFPTKEDVVFIDQAEQDRLLAQTLAHRLPGEDDIDLLVRALTVSQRMSLSAIRHSGEILRLIGQSPGLLARSAEQMINTERVLAAALVGKRARGAAVLRAHLLAGAFLGMMFTGYTTWVEGGMRGELEAMLGTIESALRSGFGRGTPAEPSEG